jgi:hypothetical protein
MLSFHTEELQKKTTQHRSLGLKRPPKPPIIALLLLPQSRRIPPGSLPALGSSFMNSPRVIHTGVFPVL